MAPSGLAILMGAGPTTGAGIARILAHPSHGNLAVALLSRSGDASLASSISKSSNGGTVRAFKTDTSEPQLQSAFKEIKEWSRSLGQKSEDLKLQVAIWNIKHSHKTPFTEETSTQFGDSLQTYVTGAMVFAQLTTKWMLDQYPAHDAESKAPLQKRGTLIFTGTLGSLRTSAGFAAYGAGRAGVRMLAQSLAREYSAQGLHVVHAIANGGITDQDKEGEKDREMVEQGSRIRAESVGLLYLTLMRQGVDLWVHELDMRPAAEKF